MMKGLRKFFKDGGPSKRVTLRYWSAEVEAGWTIDDEGDDTLQIVYTRKSLLQTKPEGPREEEFWLHLHPDDAAVIGKIMMAYAAANGAS